MSSTLSPTGTEPVEAVIISGPRKGDIVLLNGDDVRLTPEEERLFDEFSQQLERTLRTAREAVAAIQKSREEYRAG